MDKTKYSFEDQEFIEQIGKGSFGKVSKIKNSKDGKIQVWKEIFQGEMSKREQQQMINELNIHQTLEHQHIVKQIHQLINKQEKKLYLVMEQCEDGDLGALIKKLRKNSKSIDEPTIWKIFVQVVQALDFLHGQKNKVLHRDIKPGNIFLKEGGKIKLGDFGLSKQFGEESVYAQSHVGTPYQMCPEQVNQQKQNEKCDIWGLGCLLYEMVTLRPPFTAQNHMQLAMKIRAGKIENLPSGYSPELQRVIEWCLMQDHVKRPLTGDLLGVPRLSVHLRQARLKSHVTTLEKARKSFENADSNLKKSEQHLSELEQQQKQKLELKGRMQEKAEKLQALSQELDKMESSLSKGRGSSGSGTLSGGTGSTQDNSHINSGQQLAERNEGSGNNTSHKWFLEGNDPVDCSSHTSAFFPHNSKDNDEFSTFTNYTHSDSNNNHNNNEIYTSATKILSKLCVDGNSNQAQQNNFNQQYLNSDKIIGSYASKNSNNLPVNSNNESWHTFGRAAFQQNIPRYTKPNKENYSQ